MTYIDNLKKSIEIIDTHNAALAAWNGEGAEPAKPELYDWAQNYTMRSIGETIAIVKNITGDTLPSETIRLWVRNGDIRSRKEGRDYYVDPDEVIEMRNTAFQRKSHSLLKAWKQRKS
mgnify:CR=1 FL=1